MVLHPKLPLETKEKWMQLEGNYFIYHNTTHLINNSLKKPLNLVRRYKIRKQLKHFAFKNFRKPFTLKKLKTTIDNVYEYT